MGVRECFRANCDNVLCDRYSDVYGYLCYDCFEELIVYGPNTSLKWFMSGGKLTDRTEDAEAKFDAIFPDRFNDEN
jgi:hypothetical protein